MSIQCVYCGIETIPGSNVPKRPKGMKRKDWKLDERFLSTLFRARTKDHVFPTSREADGFRTVTACHNCNQHKADLTVDEWRVIRFMRGESPFFYFDRTLPQLLLNIAKAYLVRFVIPIARFA